MPWGEGPMKGAVSSDIPGEPQSGFDPGVPEWGNPAV